MIVSTIPPMRSDRVESSWMASERSCEEAATWRIAWEAWLAASTPCWAIVRAAPAASAVSCAVVAERPAARAASVAELRADSTTRTCVGAGRDIGDRRGDSSMAFVVSPDVLAICCEAAETVPAELETSPIVAPSFARIALEGRQAAWALPSIVSNVAQSWPSSSAEVTSTVVVTGWHRR